MWLFCGDFNYFHSIICLYSHFVSMFDHFSSLNGCFVVIISLLLDVLCLCSLFVCVLGHFQSLHCDFLSFVVIFYAN